MGGKADCQPAVAGSFALSVPTGQVWARPVANVIKWPTSLMHGSRATHRTGWIEVACPTPGGSGQSRG
eukprot:gene19110-biopygen3983